MKGLSTRIITSKMMKSQGAPNMVNIYKEMSIDKDAMYTSYSF